MWMNEECSKTIFSVPGAMMLVCDVAMCVSDEGLWSTYFFEEGDVLAMLY